MNPKEQKSFPVGVVSKKPEQPKRQLVLGAGFQRVEGEETVGEVA